VTFAHRKNAADASHFSATNNYRNTTKIKKTNGCRVQRLERARDTTIDRREHRSS
jgi:hypothetical protein